MSILNKIESVVDFILRWFCIILFAVLVLLIAFQILVRFTGGGHAYTELLARVIFIWQGIIGAAYVIGENDDVAIDFLVKKFKPVVVKFFEVLAHSVVAFFAVWVMIYGGWMLAQSGMDQNVELLPTSQGMLYMILPVSGVLILFYCILHIIKAIISDVHVVDDEDIDIAAIQEEGI